MPSIASLAISAGVTPAIFCRIVNVCFSPSTREMYGIYSVLRPHSYLSISGEHHSLVSAVADHYHTHRVHHRGIRHRNRLNNQDVSEQANTSKIGIGCDPEFEVWDPVALRSISFRHGSISSVIGVDGDGSTGELRPKWNKNPVKVFQTIDRLISEVNQYVSAEHVIVAGEGKGKSTGGHIHISGLGQEMPSPLIQAMDMFIAAPIGECCNGYRKSSMYNVLSSWRRQNGRFEYRSAASWLAHPILTKGALVIASVLSNEQKNNKPMPADNDDLLDRAPNVEERLSMEMFFMFLKNMKDQGKFLEELDVLKVWGKRKNIQMPVPVSSTEGSTNNLNSFRVVCNNDTNMPQSMFWHRDSGVVFSGAGEHRGRNRIFLPHRLMEYAIDIRAFFVCEILEWELDSIGFSLDMRTDPTVVQTMIETILEIIAP